MKPGRSFRASPPGPTPWRSVSRLGGALLFPGVLLLATASFFQPVTGPREWSFPEDHGAHRQYQVEWWYYTGHLATDTGRRYGYELVFFRYGLDPGRDLPGYLADWRPGELYPAHLALTDEEGRKFSFVQRLERNFGGKAGADSADLNVWCGDWRARRKGSAHQLEASAGDWSLSLELVPLKPPVLQGKGGVSRKGPEPGQASYYYSFTRMATSGVLNKNGALENVTGTSWMDHEFFSSELDTTLVGWDWFSIQLDDRTELMLYRLRGREAAADWPSGTFIREGGTAVPLGRGDFTIEPLGTWKSPRTGVDYPSGWRIAVPSQSLELELRPTIEDQELDTRTSTGVVYWEGSVRVAGRRKQASVKGDGYVELTGYGQMTPLGKRSMPKIR